MHISHFWGRLPRSGLVPSVLLLLLVTLASTATGLRCYACGPEEGLGDCDNFNPSSEHAYAKECPPSSQGCSTQSKGKNIINMACEDYKVNDCQIANDIEYCYCSSDLCNGKKPPQKSITISSIDQNDDEDLTEGSGYNTVFSNSGTTVPTLEVTLPPLNTGDNLHSTFIIIVASILLP